MAVQTPDPASKLFQPIKIGPLQLKHRIVMAPLTRFRADIETNVPHELAPKYYAQRASPGGLLITEATYISPRGGGYPGAPGIWSPEQVSEWRSVVEAVHAKGGYIFAQLWALGRVASPDAIIGGRVIGPVDQDFEGHPVHGLTEEEILELVDEYVAAAKNALAVGFDGVEIHGANGYLLDQFLQAVSNTRADQYGGAPLENRIRFPLAVVNAVCAAVGAEKVGLRMSPFNQGYEMGEPDPLATFVPWTEAVLAAQPKLAYIHTTTLRLPTGMTKEGAVNPPNPADSVAPLRKVANGAGVPFIVAGGFNPKTALEAGELGDLVAFGRSFISTPDLVERIKNGWPLTPYKRETFYTRGAAGYTDYPFYDKSAVETKG